MKTKTAIIDCYIIRGTATRAFDVMHRGQRLHHGATVAEAVTWAINRGFNRLAIQQEEARR